MVVMILWPVISEAKRTTWQTQEDPSCNSVTRLSNPERFLLLSPGFFLIL